MLPLQVQRRKRVRDRLYLLLWIAKFRPFVESTKVVDLTSTGPISNPRTRQDQIPDPDPVVEQAEVGGIIFGDYLRQIS